LICFAYWCHLVESSLYLMPENRCPNVLYQLINECPNPWSFWAIPWYLRTLQDTPKFLGWLKIGDDFGSKNGHKSTMDDLDDYGTFGHRIEPSNIFSTKMTKQCDGINQYFGVSEKKNTLWYTKS
jgi:hypothetical protein